MSREVTAEESDLRIGLADGVEAILAGTERVRKARARLERQANPQPIEKPRLDTTAEALTQADDGKKNAKGKAVTVTDKRIISESDTHVGAGESKAKQKGIQALTLVELLYNAKLIDMNMLMAADKFRDMHAEREGHSQGVSGYGSNPGGSNPGTKADRRGRVLTGYEIQPNGVVLCSRCGRAAGKGCECKPQRPKTNAYDYDAALLAMSGVINIEGRRVHDKQLQKIMIAALTHNIDMPTQTHIARLRTKYTGEKQLPPAGATVVTEAVKKLTLFLGYDGSSDR